MDFKYAALQFPIVYIDSSVLLRSPNIDFSNMTMRFAHRNPEGFHQILETIEEQSNNESEYYRRIVRLQKYGLISTLITLETANEVVFSNSLHQIALFGNIKNAGIYASPTQLKGPNDLILWGESVNFKNYNDATVAVANAENLVVDAGFLKTNVGGRLLQSTSSKCKIFMLSNYSESINIAGTSIAVASTPQQFIEELFNCRCSIELN